VREMATEGFEGNRDLRRVGTVGRGWGSAAAVAAGTTVAKEPSRRGCTILYGTYPGDVRD